MRCSRLTLTSVMSAGWSTAIFTSITVAAIQPSAADRSWCSRRSWLALDSPSTPFPSWVEFPGAFYEEIDGEVELVPGVWIVPTPGHTAGHQSVVARCGDGTIILAGQAHDTASAYAAELCAAEAQREGARDGLPSIRAWIERLQDFDPRRIVFAHDSSVVEPL